MNEIFNSLYNGLSISDDMKAFLITFIFMFIITVTVEILVTVKGLGSK